MLNKYFYNLSTVLFGILTLVFVLSSIGFIIHLPINAFNVLIPLLIGVFYLKKVSETKNEFLVQLLFLLIIILISYYISLAFWDYSWDGRSYHASAIIMLKKGWLPVYDNVSEITEKFVLYPFNTAFADTYPKFCEILGANFYKITGYIESSKTANFILFISAFMYSCFVLNNFISKKIINYILSFAVCLNPVCICQLCTNLVDIQLYFAFVFLLLTVLKIEKSKNCSKTDYFIIISSSLMLASIKLTGIAYLVVIYFCWGVFRLLQKNEVRTVLKSSILVFILTLITCINPYLTNLKNHNNPFYPVMGKNKIDVITMQYPRGFKDKTPFQRFLISTFAESINSIENHSLSILNKPVFIKIPFTRIKYSALSYFKVADMRVGGFGYYWSGILCLTFLLFFFLRFESKEDKRLFLFLLITIVLSVSVNPHAWWARFVPQLWLIPVFTVLFALLSENNNFKKIKNLISYICLFFILLNSLIILKQQAGYVSEFSNYQRAFFYIVEKRSTPSGICFMRNHNYKDNFADETIRPHLEERLIKIKDVDFDINKIEKERFLGLQISPIHDTYYFYKPALFDKEYDK